MENQEYLDLLDALIIKSQNPIEYSKLTNMQQSVAALEMLISESMRNGTKAFWIPEYVCFHQKVEEGFRLLGCNECVILCHEINNSYKKGIINKNKIRQLQKLLIIDQFSNIDEKKIQFVKDNYNWLIL